MKNSIIGLAAVGVMTLSAAAVDWRPIPLQEVGGERAGGYDMGRLEVLADEFVAYLNGTGIADFPETAQIMKKNSGRYVVRKGLGRQAVAEIMYAEAVDFARWLAEKQGRRIRLPTPEEWEFAARGGVEGAPFPWGWGGPPEELAAFNMREPPVRAGGFPANGFGLRDMAGGVYEWCLQDDELPDAAIIACGGAWPEWADKQLMVTNRIVFDRNYRGRDVGFRVLREWE